MQHCNVLNDSCWLGMDGWMPEMKFNNHIQMQIINTARCGYLQSAAAPDSKRDICNTVIFSYFYRRFVLPLLQSQLQPSKTETWQEI